MNRRSQTARRVSRRTVTILLSLGLLALVPLAWYFQGRWSGAPKPDYRATGLIVALIPPPSTLHATRPVIVIYHDRVPGLMDEAMSMPFIAASSKLFEGVRPGDRIAFGLKVTPDALLVVSIKRLTPGSGK
jgi:hypothetical protein